MAIATVAVAVALVNLHSAKINAHGSSRSESLSGISPWGAAAPSSPNSPRPYQPDTTPVPTPTPAPAPGNRTNGMANALEAASVERSDFSVLALAALMLVGFLGDRKAERCRAGGARWGAAASWWSVHLATVFVVTHDNIYLFGQ